MHYQRLTYAPESKSHWNQMNNSWAESINQAEDRYLSARNSNIDVDLWREKRDEICRDYDIWNNKYDYSSLPNN